jgi:hypothetical protein
MHTAYRIILLLLSLINGGWMLFDGLHVLIYGRYFGPEQPGPWSGLVAAIGLNPFKLGPVFVLWGLLWLGFVAAWLLAWRRARMLGLIIAVLTLWYVPVGSLTSLIVLLLLLRYHSNPNR